MPVPPILPETKLIPPSRSQLLNATDRRERKLRALSSRLDIPVALRLKLWRMANADFTLLFRAGRRK